MKVTKETLKSLIREVLEEQEAARVDEATQNVQYDRIMRMFSGELENVDQIAILTPENPHAKPIPKPQNEARKEEFENEMASMGYGFRIISGMYEGPEDSYVVPHMTLDAAKKLSYKYGQESFIHSRKQMGDADTPPMLHQMYYLDFSDKMQDPSYSIKEYGPVYQIPQEVPIKDIEKATSISDHDTMKNAPDYYSHVQDKVWKTKKKGAGEERDFRPSGMKKGKKFSIDFFAGKEEEGLPDFPTKSPRYVREANYVFIKESEVPSTIEAQKLSSLIKELSSMVSESDRKGSSVFYGRKRLLKAKKALREMIDRGDK